MIVSTQTSYEMWRLAVEQGKAAEMRVAGIVRGGRVYNGSFYFVGSRSVGYQKAELNETLKYHKKA